MSKYNLGKITKSIIFANILNFIIMCIYDKSLFAPSQSVLLLFGGNDPVALAHGEWWRLVTANFVHFGVFHLFLNMFALRIIGSYMEDLIGSWFFLGCYFCSGICAFIFSSLFNFYPSSGASGAIFGLIGAGVVLENYSFYNNFGAFFRIEGKNFREKWRLFFGVRPFSFIAILNLMISFLFNILSSLFNLFSVRIDNAAHLGGMIVGGFYFLSLCVTRKKALRGNGKIFGIFLSVSIVFFILLGSYLLTKTHYIKNRFMENAIKSSDSMLAIYLYSNVISIDYQDPLARFNRGVLLMNHNEYTHAQFDFSIAAKNPDLLKKIEKMQDLLIKESQLEKAIVLQQVIEEL